MGIRVTVRSSLTGMGNSYAAKPALLRTGIQRVGGEAARDGRDTWKRIARFRYGSGHARKYAGKISSARTGSSQWEYGPTVGGQGTLAPILERGSRNNPPHLNGEQAADIATPGFYRSTDSMLDGIFDGR